MTAPLLDTIAWIWWVDGDRRLGKHISDALDELPRGERPYLSDVSLWEAARLVERGQLSLDMPLLEWLEAAAHPRSVRVVAVTPKIAADLATLPPAFRGDPADRIVVSTARVLGAPVLTHDPTIARSGLVTRWRARV